MKIKTCRNNLRMISINLRRVSAKESQQTITLSTRRMNNNRKKRIITKNIMINKKRKRKHNTRKQLFRNSNT